MGFLTALAALASVALTDVVAQFPADQNIPTDVDPLQLANNSLYFRWRPTYHFLAPGGHMNDPCGPMYDPVQDTYHLFYQSFPQHINGGNKTWGHAKSKDMITWEDVRGWENRSFVAIEPEPFSVPSYDWLGVFSGGGYPTNLQGEQDGTLMVMYTGNVIVPDYWEAPYVLGPATGTPYATEQQAIATSKDGGETWQKWEGNPWLNGQPGHWNTTGLRDPVFAPNPELDKILLKSEPHFYLVLGSGIRTVGPRIPLFSAKSTDLTNWTFEGALWEVPLHYSFGGDRTKTGNYGGNYEVASFWDEVEKEEYGGDGETRHWLACVGSEGYGDEVGHPFNKWSLFVLGDVTRRENGSAELNIKASGVLDWGNAYALNTFYDKKNDRRVIWGWSQEDFSNLYGWAQGYVSTFTLPQEIFVLKFHHVLAPEDGVPEESSAFWTPNNNGTYTVTTVGQHPLPEVVAGIQGRKHALVDEPLSVTSYEALDVESDHFHIRAAISELPKAEEGNYVGLRFRASPGGEEYGQVKFFPSENRVVLDRSHSTTLPYIGTVDFKGYFEPLHFANGTSEKIVFDLFVDGSLIEVFINSRFAMTHKIYPGRYDSLGAGLISSGNSTFESVDFWEMEKNVWPERPLNASSALIYDKYYEYTVTIDNPYVPNPYKIYDGN